MRVWFHSVLAVAVAVALALAPAPALAGGEADGASPLTTTSADSVLRGEADLRTALYETSLGHPRSAVDDLVRWLAASAGNTDAAGRGIFLLTWLQFGLGDAPGALAAGDLAPRSNDSAFGAWSRSLGLLGALQQGGASVRVGVGPDDSPAPAAALLEAVLMLGEGKAAQAESLAASIPPDHALDVWGGAVAARAREARGLDAESQWRRLADREPRTPAEIEFIAEARLAAGLAAARRGEPGSPRWLSVPEGTRARNYARHLVALEAAASGGYAEASAALADLLRDHPTTPGHREARRLLAAAALEREQWAEADSLYDGLAREIDALDATWGAKPSDLEVQAIWSGWDETRRLGFDPSPVVVDADALALESLDMTREPTPQEPPLGDARRVAGNDVSGPMAPSAETWRELNTLRAEALESRSHQARAAWRLERLAELAELREAYLTVGNDRARLESSTGQALLARLDEQLAALAARVAALDAVSEETLARAMERAARLAHGLAEQRYRMDALRTLHLEGPGGARALPVPAEFPTAEAALVAEIETGEAAARALDTFAEVVPDLIRRSRDEVWRPSLRARGDRLTAERERHGHHLERTLAALAEPRIRPEDALVADATAAQAAWRDRADSLLAMHTRRQREVVTAALEQGRRELEREREAVALGSTLAGYELALVDLDRGNSGSGAAASLAEARTRLEGYLGRYPNSPARGEFRYRLADVLLLEEEHALKQRLAERGGASDTPIAFQPADPSPAITLYRMLVEEDGDYLHRDAALFNLALLLLDEGDPEGAVLLATLLSEFPASDFGQEARVRLGDARFAEGDLDTAARLYADASEGADAGLRAVALYELGWTWFVQDEFEQGARVFLALLDAHVAGEEGTLKTDLREEARAHLVECLARDGGAEAFARFFAREGSRPYDADILLEVGVFLQEASMFTEAAAAHALFLDRFPLHPRALDSAARLIDAHEAQTRTAQADAARLELAERFLPGAPWSRAVDSDSLRAAGENFSREALRRVALERHHRARQEDRPGGWEASLEIHERLITLWSEDGETPLRHMLAAEAAAHLSQYESALAHYRVAAASDTARFAADADWELVAVTDAWYRSTLPAGSDPLAVGDDALAERLGEAAARFVERRPGDPRGAEGLWRAASVTWTQDQPGRAAEGFGRIPRLYPDHDRAIPAAVATGDAWHAAGDYDRAAEAYARALPLVRARGDDSLAVRVEQAIPAAWYRHGERLSERGDHPAAGETFARVARQWPDFEHGRQAWYRAGLELEAGGNTEEAVASWTQLVGGDPQAPLARDAHLQIAAVWAEAGSPRRAALAYRRFSDVYPADPQSADALWNAADLLASEGDAIEAQRIRLEYIKRFPEDVETAMSVLSELALRELDGVGPDRPISSLLNMDEGNKTSGYLASYLQLAGSHAEFASPEIQAHAAYLQAEEEHRACSAIPLSQPLDTAIRARREALERTLAAYRECAETAVPVWTRAAGFRMGEVLVQFGEALLESERPGDLSSEEIEAYESVLEEEAWNFFDSGEAVWGELIERARDTSGDPGDWVARTRQALWPRLAQRFLYRPEVEYPLIATSPPDPEAEGRSWAESILGEGGDDPSRPHPTARQ